MPPQLAQLSELSELSLAGNRIQGGWRSLPRQLQRLDLSVCGMEHRWRLPAELSSWDQLSKLSLSDNLGIEGGWENLPASLRELDLSKCSLRLLPSALSVLTRLSSLDLSSDYLESSNRISGGSSWEHLAPSLERLDLGLCGLRQVPAALSTLSRLRTLSLFACHIEGGWQRLPPCLRELDLRNCVRQLPVELAGLTQLTRLLLSGGYDDEEIEDDEAGFFVEGGWAHLPASLRELDLTDAGLSDVPEPLARLTQLSALVLSGNAIAGGWACLPGQLERLDLSSCVRHIPEELAALTALTQLGLASNSWTLDGFDRLPPQLLDLDLTNDVQRVPAELERLTRLTRLKLNTHFFSGASLQRVDGWRGIPQQLRRQEPRAPTSGSSFHQSWPASPG